MVEIVHQITPLWQKTVGKDLSEKLCIHVQFQQHPVRITVYKALFALLSKVFLERADSLRVVSLQAADDLGDLGRPLLWVFVVRHGGQLVKEMGGSWPGVGVAGRGREVVVEGGCVFQSIDWQGRSVPLSLIVGLRPANFALSLCELLSRIHTSERSRQNSDPA